MSQSQSVETREEQLRLKRLAAKCGPALHLVPDTVLLAANIRAHHPPARQAYITEMELRRSVRGLWEEPLMTALQAGRAAAAAVQCRHCQSSEPLTVRARNFSGSSAECLDDLIMGEGGTSDYDIMFEFGTAGAGEDCISPEEAPQLRAKPTNSPGFVTLYWARTSRCRHEAPLAALPADTIRRLMEDFCRVGSPSTVTINCSGPAVNVKESGATDGGEDHVPCLRLLWWPERDDFLSRHRETTFLPAEAEEDICSYGVHLVPTGRPGSATADVEYRVSFSRAEVVTVRHLPPVQHQTIRATKGMKTILKDSKPDTALKSYYIKTAVLWLAQEQPSERWTGVTAGVNMVLDWLERHLSAGKIPCFFWPDFNLLAGLQPAEIQDMKNTIHQMKTDINTLLLACCDKLWDLDTLLEGGSEPLSESELSLRLARRLVLRAVLNGIRYRSTAPCWEHWIRRYIPALSRLSQRRLLQWVYRSHSGTYWQQCHLLLALSVAPADLTAEMRLTSRGDDQFTWPVTPLTDLLTEWDMEVLLGEPAKVAAWCRQQLCRPPAERPAGLTAELDTPRGRAELLLQPELFLRAVSEAVPAWWAVWQRQDQEEEEKWRANFTPHRTYQQCREVLEGILSCDLESRLRRRLPEPDGPTAAATARFWRQNIQHQLSGDRLWRQYTAVTTRWPDNWQLNKHLTQDDTSQGKTRRRRSLPTHRHTSHLHCTAQWEYRARH